VPVPCCFYCYGSVVWSKILWYLQHYSFCSLLQFLSLGVGRLQCSAGSKALSFVGWGIMFR
jgi:hypothetical protein